jgi:hypothetical protein
LHRKSSAWNHALHIHYKLPAGALYFYRVIRTLIPTLGCHMQYMTELFRRQKLGVTIVPNPRGFRTNNSFAIFTRSYAVYKSMHQKCQPRSCTRSLVHYLISTQ